MTSYIYNMVDTWNASGTTFTAVKMNVTDTASASGSLLMDLQIGSVTYANVKKTGNAFLRGSQLQFGGTNNEAAGVGAFVGSNGLTGINPSGSITWRVISASGGEDLYINRRAAANLQFGAADAAAPVAQTLSVQSVVAGTTNIAGTNLTITGSQGTGTGAGGDIIFQVAPASTTGSTQNTLATALRVYNTKTVAVGVAYTVATLPAAGIQGQRAWVTNATGPTFLGTLTGGGAVVCPVFDNGTAWVVA